MSLTLEEFNKKLDQLQYAVRELYFLKYQAEFQIIDGLNQHPDGLNFQEWLAKNNYKI